MTAMKQPEPDMEPEPEPIRSVPRELAVGVLAPQWEAALPSLEPQFRQLLALLTPHIPESVRNVPLEISLTLMDDAEIRLLNKEFRNKDKPTNVLSFPQFDFANFAVLPVFPDDALLPLGDVMISYTTAAREAEEQGKAFEAHCLHLFVHGILHLLGYDHEEDAEAERMETLETRILAEFGIADPYLDDGAAL